MTMITVYHEFVSARGVSDWRRTWRSGFIDQIGENYAPAKGIRSEKSTSLLGLVPADIFIILKRKQKVKRRLTF